MNEDTNSDFEHRVKQKFDHSVSALDASTLSRITRARYQALEGNDASSNGRRVWIPAGAFASICMAFVIYSLAPQENVENKTFVDEIDIISELELYENLDFYEWLEQHELPT